MDKRVEKLNNGDATEFRKNQQQVDKNGNKVGKIRPNIQYNYKDGVHHNEEFDHKKSNSQKYEKQ
ncbi:hypothetical protein GCM10027566_03750 [Arachidicoccus ginsenosidivorans]|uniref:Uncharacterized protein n=1 Tax=Arachidicoccus ginsenosidivorans TaxID=496057 RepID=A0A5B8VN63_9BACT|nr:hypothetical protein [Arachidicoccus ginsenosidivorans]QEC72521.1 hypothetical protein FSB73_13390 [Arachidicoccus ginsenosidivorans]